MSFLWSQPNGSWSALRLPQGRFHLAPQGRVQRLPGSPPGPQPPPLLLGRPQSHGTGELWILIDPASRVRVNGEPLALGLRVLAHGDQIRVQDGPTLHLSLESLPEPVPFPGGPSPMHCPRCRQVLHPGETVVRCPGCGTYHHQTEALPCWRYATTCAHCPHETDPAAGPRWIPESDHSQGPS